MPALTSSDERDRLTEIGALVRAAREARNLSLRGLADASGVHFTTIHKLERGRANTSVVSVIRVVETLGGEVVVKI